MDLVSHRLRKLLILGLPAALLAVVVAVALIEVWVRVRWDERRGTPGFYVSDAVLGQRLGAGYDGWFAGAPVKINDLGFRDPRNYSLAKTPGTFRILVLGDSVTFGHGAVYETTYPYLLEQRLKQWRPDVEWQVWNLGVPGYNTTQELNYLERVGPRYQPDLSIIGFFENDLFGNDVSAEATVRRRVVSAVQASMQRWLYSYELYKRIALTIRWHWLASVPNRRRIEALAVDNDLAPAGTTAADADQQISNVDYFDNQAVLAFTCPKWKTVDGSGGLRSRLADGPDAEAWLSAVRELQQLHRDGHHRIVFFANMAPTKCLTEDRFHDAGSLADDAAVLDVLGQGTPAVSTTRAFLHYRPSQMPAASGHSLGNANRVKADVLFEFLRDHTLPALVPSAP